MDRNGKNKCHILLVVDVQNDFITGSLGNKEAEKIVPNVLDKVKNFKGDYIIFTRDTHTEDYLFSKEGEKLPVKHCVVNTEGWQIEGSLREWIDKNHFAQGIPVGIIDKPTFGSVPDGTSTPNVITRIERVMEEHDDDGLEIEICGLMTDICVISNALAIKAHFYDCADIYVDSSACAGVTPEKHKAALDVMSSCQINIL